MGWRCSTTSDYLRYLKRAGSFQLDSLAVEETTLVAGPLLPTEEICFRLCPEAVPSPFPLTCNVNLVLSHPAPSFWLWLFQICWQYFQIYHIPFGISDLPPFLFSWMAFFFFHPVPLSPSEWLSYLKHHLPTPSLMAPCLSMPLSWPSKLMLSNAGCFRVHLKRYSPYSHGAYILIQRVRIKWGNRC